MRERLWGPEEVRRVRRINRWTLAALCTLLLAGVVLLAVGVSTLGSLVLLLAVFALLVGSFAAMNATSAGRRVS